MKVENKQINQKKQDSEGMSSDNPSEFLKTSRIMKKTILFIACVFGALSGYAQLKVNSSGKVGINYTSSLSSSLTVGGNSTAPQIFFDTGFECPVGASFETRNEGCEL